MLKLSQQLSFDSFHASIIYSAILILSLLRIMLLQWTSYCFLVTYMPRDTCMPRVLSLPCNFVSYELNVVFEKFQWLFGCTKCGKAFVVCHVCQNCPGTRAALMTRVLDMWLYIFWTKCWFQKIPMAIWVYKVWKRFCSMPCLSELSRYTCSTDDTCPRHVIIYLLNQMLVPKNSNGYLGVQSVEKIL